MSITLANIISKTVLVGISYYNLQGDLLKQQQIAGTVVESDPEKGIAIKLLPLSDENNKAEHFVLPAALTCWFHAPAGTFTDSHSRQRIENPDFLVTWDVHQNQENVNDGTHQWWEWRPRTVPPVVTDKDNQ